MLWQNYTRCFWFYDPVTNEKKCNIDKTEKKKKTVRIHTTLSSLSHGALKSHPIAHGPFSPSRLRAESDPTRGDPAWPG